jgi:hypothetical protein
LGSVIDVHVTDREAIRDDYRQARHAFEQLLTHATPEDLRRRTNGTKWTNEELLFHMLFGYLVVRTLRPLVHLFAVLPRPVNRLFAAVLDAGTRPFDVINYLGSHWGARVVNHRRMARLFDKSLAVLLTHLDNEPDTHLAGVMQFPTRWDPFFKEHMTLLDVYRYPTRHLTFHQAQLTLPSPE